MTYPNDLLSIHAATLEVTAGWGVFCEFIQLKGMGLLLALKNSGGKPNSCKAPQLLRH